MNNKIIRASLVTLSTIGIVSFSGQASASNCKGLESAACESNVACSWVEGYQRKDGRQVKSFCRAKPAAKDKVTTKAKKTQSLLANKASKVN